MAYPTTIAAGTHVAGSIQASEDIAVEGSVQGTINLSEVLTVAAGGIVRGDIQARVAQIDGVVVGTIQATERILLGPTARVQATITSPLLQMSDGAQLAGELNIGSDGETTAPSATRASTITSRTQSTASAPARTTPASPVPSRPLPSTPTQPTPRTTAPTAVPQAVTTVTVVENTQTDEETTPEPSTPTVDEVSAEETPETTPETVTFQELDDDYTVKELREELRRRDLPVTGSKSELIERLLEAESQST